MRSATYNRDIHQASPFAEWHGTDQRRGSTTVNTQLPDKGMKVIMVISTTILQVFGHVAKIQ